MDVKNRINIKEYNKLISNIREDISNLIREYNGEDVEEYRLIDDVVDIIKYHIKDMLGLDVLYDSVIDIVINLDEGLYDLEERIELKEIDNYPNDIVKTFINDGIYDDRDSTDNIYKIFLDKNEDVYIEHIKIQKKTFHNSVEVLLNKLYKVIKLI